MRFSCRWCRAGAKRRVDASLFCDEEGLEGVLTASNFAVFVPPCGKPAVRCFVIKRGVNRELGLNGFCLTAAPVCVSGELGFLRRSSAQRRSPLVVRGRLLELRCRARPRFP